MKKLELMIYDVNRIEHIKKIKFYRFFIHIAVFLMIGTIIGISASIYHITKLKTDIETLQNYEPDMFVEKNLVKPFYEKLAKGIVKIHNFDDYSKEIFEVPCVQNHYDYEIYTSGYVTAADLYFAMNLDSKLEKVNLLHIRRFSNILLNEYAKRIANSKKILYHLELENIIFQHTPSIWPTTERVTSNFGFRRSPFNGMPSFHEGTDLGAIIGTPVKSSADGIVVFAGTRTGYGFLVTVDHGFGFITRYAHNNNLLVKPGDFVKKGDIIALSGNTGRSAGPHLHYEVLYNGTPVNSVKFIPNEGKTRR